MSAGSAVVRFFVLVFAVSLMCFPACTLDDGVYFGSSIFTPSDSEIVPVDDLLAGTKALSVEWDNDIKSDEFYVAWYLYRGDKKMDDLNIVTYKISNAYSSVFNPADIFHAPVFEKANEDIEGFYYAVVKNVLNGVESTYNAGPIDAEGKLDPGKMFNVTGS